MGQQRFQVNLGGVIDLLSNHLYSTPAVFVRELLQNATDAIRARQRLERGHRGAIRVAVDGPTLTVSDDGIGLTEEEIHQFLATIGESSKRGGVPDPQLGPDAGFIGQFGIGLLSCFIVSREIQVRTRSAGRPDAPTLLWRGRDDGTYEVRPAPAALAAPGTEVVLTARDDRREYFEPDRVEELARRYGGLLPIPITLGATVVNAAPPPWARTYEDAAARRADWLAYGEQLFETKFLDVLPLRSEVGDVQGLAFVLPATSRFGARQKHRVYLKHMLLSEDAEELLPHWAFFVRCVVNANDLRPTANREAFYADARLEEVREALGAALRAYLVTMARESPAALRRLLSLHDLAMRALALDDDEFFALAADWFPFETSLGVMSLGEFRRAHAPVRYVGSVDEFRQVARIAGAQGVGVLNAGYVHGVELVEKLPEVFPEVSVERFSPGELAEVMEDLTLDERDLAADLLACATRTLRPFGVEPAVKRFHPPDVPAMYAVSQAQLFDRDVGIAADASDELFAGILADVRKGARPEPPQLVFNLNNPVVRRLCGLRDEDRQAVFVQLLYVQALLLGQHPLQARELAILNQGLESLMALHLEALGGGEGFH